MMLLLSVRPEFIIPSVFHENKIAAIVYPVPSILSHVLGFAPLWIKAIAKQRRQLVLLAGITIKLLRTFYIPVVWIRDSNIYES